MTSATLAPTAKHAFSLVELSIVLVILGLLTGGILTGQSLIRAAELRSITTDFNRYQTAVMTFRDKYFALPGDMKNATDFWGAAHSDFMTCGTTEGTGTQTCNGDGDGDINVVSVSDGNIDEIFRSWQHLVNAGMIEGQYTGIRDASSTGRTLGVNIPASKITPGSFSMGITSNNAHDYTDISRTGRIITLANHEGEWSDMEIISPEEAWNIDKKIDDGAPGTGKVISSGSDSTDTPNCATTNTAATAQYQLTLTSVECAVKWYW